MDQPGNTPAHDRRDFLTKATTTAVTGGLVLGYGACAAMGVRYLYPARPRELRWQFVARVAQLEVGDSISYRSPTGERIAVARLAEDGVKEDFVALSSTCPHLGCQVHWEGHNDRFFCPCHNGIFDREGAPVSGPPAEADQALPRFPLEIRGGLLYIQVPVEGLTG